MIEKEIIELINDELKGDNATFLSNLELKFLPTRSRLLNVFLSNKKKGGGIIYGRDGMMTISGDPATGKSLLAAEIGISTQLNGGVCLYLDTEHAVNKDFFKRMGADPEKFIISEPGTLEEGFKIIEKTVLKLNDVKQENSKNLTIIWDSIAATPSSFEEEDQSYNPQNSIGLSARIISKALRKINAIMAVNNVSIIFLNQLRTAIGQQYGDTDVEYGGKALQFYAATRLKLKKESYIYDSADKENKRIIGTRTKMILMKSRVGSPRKEIVFRIYHDKGIDDLLTLKDLAKDYGFIKASGAWSNIEFMGEKTSFQGDDEFLELMNKKPDLKEWLYSQVEDKIIDYYVKEENKG